MKTLIVFLLMAGAAYAQTPPRDTSCMALWFNPHTTRVFPNTRTHDSLANITFNPDSIAEDTCSSNPSEIWLHHGWFLSFEDTVINASPGLQFPPVSDDSAIELADWTAIDTLFPIIRQQMKAIYDSVGPFRLRRRLPNTPAPYFMFQFNSWTSNDSILKYILDYPDSRDFFWLDATINFPGQEDVKQSNTPLRVWPQPASGTLYVSNAAPREEIYLIDPLGRRIRSWKPEISDNGVIELDLHGLSAGVYFLCSESLMTKVIVSQ